jgi:hypothetical protein
MQRLSPIAHDVAEQIGNRPPLNLGDAVNDFRNLRVETRRNLIGAFSLLP